MEFVSQLSMVPVPPAGSLGIVRCLLCTAVIDTPIKLSRKLETKCVPQLFLESLLGTRRTAISNNDGDGNENGRKAICLDSQNNYFARASRVHHAFLYISLPSLHDYDVKRPNLTFCVQREFKVAIFIIFSQLSNRPLDFNFRKIRQLLTNWTRQPRSQGSLLPRNEPGRERDGRGRMMIERTLINALFK